MKRWLLAFIAHCAIGLQGQTIIEVSFPDGTGTNPTFLEIDNGLGGGTGTWTQSTGVLFSTTTNNSTTGAASETTIDFTALGPDDSLVLRVEVSSRTGTNVANGMFIGFQQRNAGGVGTDLWNNTPPSFGLVIPGNASGGLIFNRVAAGGSDPSNPGRYQVAPGYGVVTAESLADGFGVTLTVSSAGWEIALTGLEEAGGNAITGGAGEWGVDGVNDWAEFNDQMRVGFSYQTNAGGGELRIASISLKGDAPTLDPLGLDVRNVNDELEISWNSSAGKLYNLRSITDPSTIDPKDWPIHDGQMNLPATPDRNTLTISRPGDAERFFVIEEFPIPPVTIFMDDFESGQGAWTLGSDGEPGSDWELGPPSNVGPATANSGVNCFGTNLDGDYAVNGEVWLRSPAIDLTTATGANLTYAEFKGIEEMFDSGTVSVLDASDDSLIAEIQSGIEGVSTQWDDINHVLPSEALGKVIKIEFRMSSDDFNNQAGWYIDDVAVTVPGA